MLIRKRCNLLIDAAIFGLFIILSCLLLLIKWQWFSSYAFTSDVFSYSRTLANTLNGHFMWEPTHSYVFGNHAYLVLILFLPIYLFWNSAFVLIGSSVLAHLLATVFIFKISQRLFHSKWVGYAVAATYFLNVFILEQILMPVYGFQPDVWAAPFIFAAVHFYYSAKT